MSDNPRYRPDIDGLRAIAVIPVVLFHAGIPLFRGGFVGVDVFFVISGYLISSLILPELMEGKFSILTFYERRIRRIFPAVFGLMLVSLVVGYWLLLPQPFVEFSKTALATTFFASNVLFWRQAGYFDAPGESKPLLHTWSLAVEEQFYILFPLFLMMVVRWRRHRLKWLTAGAALLSFVVSVYGVAYKPSAAFYLAPTRAWELLIGALLAMGVFRRELSGSTSAALGLTGLVLIGYAVFAFSSLTPFPGASALVPCLGTALVIYSGMASGNAVTRLLSFRPIVFIGLISYSLYLWHWPLLVWTKFYLSRSLKPTEAIGIALGSILLALLSWKFIEQPFRQRELASSRKAIFAFGAVCMTLVASLSLWVWFGNGFPNRMPPEAVNVSAVSAECAKPRDHCNSLGHRDVHLNNLCLLGTAMNPEFLLWGDSHAENLRESFGQAAKLIGISGVQATRAGCPPMLGVARKDLPPSQCVEFNEAVLRVAANSSVKKVVLVARWAFWAEGTRYLHEQGANPKLINKQNLAADSSTQYVFKEGLDRLLSALSALGKEIVIVASIPEVGWDVPTVLGMELWQGREIHAEPALAEYWSRNRFVFELFTKLQPTYNFKLIFPHEVLCDTRLCRVTVNQQPLYCDTNHLSERGQRLLVPAFVKVLAEN